MAHLGKAWIFALATDPGATAIGREIAATARFLPMNEREAAHLAETVDRDRAAFIAQYFKVEWPDRHRFHLMVNSAIGEAAAVDTILGALDLYQKRQSHHAATASHSVAS